MFKILLLLLVGLAIYLLVRGRRTRAPDGYGQTTASPEAMVACAHCGVHLPVSESLAADDSHYCCSEHLRLGPTYSRRN